MSAQLGPTGETGPEQLGDGEQTFKCLTDPPKNCV